MGNDVMDLFDEINEVILKHTGEGCDPADVMSAVEMVFDALHDETNEVAK